MADSDKRIYNLPDSGTPEDSYLAIDKVGNPDAERYPLNALNKIIPYTLTSAYGDFNDSGWESLNGQYVLSVTGSQISNCFFTPVPAANYIIFADVINLTGILHITRLFVYVDSDPDNLNRQAARSGSDLSTAITAGWTPYTISPFNYVGGIQEQQTLHDVDIFNDTDTWMNIGTDITWNELDPTSTLRFDWSYFVEGINPLSKIQFRVLENGTPIYTGGVIDIGTASSSLTFFTIVTSHSPITPTTYAVEFQNVDAAVWIRGSQKSSNFIATEFFSTSR